MGLAFVLALVFVVGLALGLAFVLVLVLVVGLALGLAFVLALVYVVGLVLGLAFVLALVFVLGLPALALILVYVLGVLVSGFALVLASGLATLVRALVPVLNVSSAVAESAPFPGPVSCSTGSALPAAVCNTAVTGVGTGSTIHPCAFRQPSQLARLSLVRTRLHFLHTVLVTSAPGATCTGASVGSTGVGCDCVVGVAAIDSSSTVLTFSRPCFSCAAGFAFLLAASVTLTRGLALGAFAVVGIVLVTLAVCVSRGVCWSCLPVWLSCWGFGVEWAILIILLVDRSGRRRISSPSESRSTPSLS